MIADLDPDRIAAELRTHRYGRSIAVLAETGSTNDDARAALERGAPDGHVVVADRQSAGRGSRGRAWSSPGGTDLYLSIAARVPLPPARLAPLTLAVGLGVSVAIEALIERATQVKWPNDVLAGDRKLSGILVEASTHGARLDGVVIGIGVDVNRDSFAPELAELATSMKRVRGQGLDRAIVLARVLEHVEEELDRFVAHGPSAIVDRVQARLALIGERVLCDDVEGTLLGLAPDGALLIRTEEGVRPIVSGTLRRQSG